MVSPSSDTVLLLVATVAAAAIALGLAWGYFTDLKSKSSSQDENPKT